jgi:hypothetical protein
MPFNTQAQDKVKYSVETGFTISSFSRETAPFADPTAVKGFDKAVRTSIEVGGNVNYRLTNVFTLSGGIRYTEKGGSYKTKNPDFAYVNTFSGVKVDDAYNYLRYRLVYLEIPVVLKINAYNLLNIAAAKSSALFLYGGLSGMLNIGSKFRYNKFTADEKESWESEPLKGAEDLLLSWVAGVEWNGDAFIIYTRYTRNIGNVYDMSLTGSENFDLDMGTVSLGLGVVID